MRILCTFPGRAGDLIWALPTVRALSAHFGTPVDLQIAGEFAGLVPVLAQQPYLGTLTADPRWGMDGSPAPALVAMRAGVADPEAVPMAWDRVFHLAYPGWPARPLPFEVEATLHAQWNDARDGAPPRVDLGRPWIRWPKTNALVVPAPLAVGFTDCWFELKAGLIACLRERAIADLPTGALVVPPGSRWDTELGFEGCGWTQAAQLIRDCHVFLGDCSALHVLAVALGTPVVCVEPMEARWNPIFYPLGTHDRVRLVRGLDGLPSFDARHTAETLEQVLRGTAK